jgi:hypothetical protein
MAGSPTHPVMPNLVMLWKMSPLRGGVRVGARLWARGRGAPPAGAGPQLGPNGIPGGLADPWARHGRRRRGAGPAQGYFLSLIISRVSLRRHPTQAQHL